MIVVCEKCNAKFKLSDEKVPPGGVKVRCSKCKHSFRVYRPGDEPAKEPVPKEPTPPQSQQKAPGEEDLSKQIDEILSNLNLDSASQEEQESSFDFSFGQEDRATPEPSTAGTTETSEDQFDLTGFESFAVEDASLGEEVEPESTSSGEDVPAEDMISSDFSLDAGGDEVSSESDTLSADVPSIEDIISPEESNVEDSGFLSTEDFDTSVPEASGEMPESPEKEKELITSDFDLGSGIEGPDGESIPLSTDETSGGGEVTDSTFEVETTSSPSIDLNVLNVQSLQDITTSTLMEVGDASSETAAEEATVLDIKESDTVKKRVAEISLIERRRQKAAMLRERRRGVYVFTSALVIAIFVLLGVGAWRSGADFTRAFVNVLVGPQRTEAMIEIAEVKFFKIFSGASQKHMILVKAQLRKPLRQPVPVKVEAVDERGRLVESHLVYPGNKLTPEELVHLTPFEIEARLSQPATDTGSQRDIYAVFFNIDSESNFKFRFSRSF